MDSGAITTEHGESSGMVAERGSPDAGATTGAAVHAAVEVAVEEQVNSIRQVVESMQVSVVNNVAKIGKQIKEGSSSVESKFCDMKVVIE